MFLKLQFVKKKFFLKDSFKISRDSKTIVKAIIIKLSQTTAFTANSNFYPKLLQEYKSN
jgi:hypothetical protein